MNQNDKKYILKKLMQDALAEEEVAALNDRVAIKPSTGRTGCIYGSTYAGG